jgi:RNA polymerase sigma-70 factor (ECF subfamily)
MAAPDEDELALVARARAGDPAAFRALVARHKDRAYALALRLVGTPSDAEEVAQDAFVRAWRALPGFRAEAAFGTWLHRIVSRLALDRRERLVTRARRETPTAEPPDIAPESPDEPPAEGDAAGRLERLLARLPERARAAVVLYYYEDQSVLEVARRLGVPENTVKTLLARARTTLREAWTREEARQA